MSAGSVGAPEGVARFLEIRSDLRRHRAGDGGWDTCRVLTASLDAAVAELAAGVAGETVAVVAVGGYGRGELCLFSDVDIMILHRSAALKPVTDAVLYPLWDANLKVGHSVRTVKEAVAVAADDFDTLTSLLTMRCLAGAVELVGELEQALRPVLRHDITPQLVERERERRLLDPYPVMSADLKEGRGGMRTYQAALWQRRRHELLDEPFEPDRPERRLNYGHLLAARNALHAGAGRAVDRFHGELRIPAARWLGSSVEELAAQVMTALHHGDRLVERAHPELNFDDFEATTVRRSIRWRLGRRRRAGDEGEIGVDTGQPPLVTALQLAGRAESTWRGTAAEEALQRAAWRKAPWTDADRAALLRILRAGAPGRAAWALLGEIGWMANHLPEWQVVADRPQLAPFHEHPVGAHLWRTVDEMLALADDPEDEHASIAAEIGSQTLLVLAAFFHDIGKGHGGDHSEVGAEIVTDVLLRFGFEPDVIATVATVTRHHLLLSETATRRDLDDPRVVDAVARAVGDARTLGVLYLLSIADGRATGSGMTSDWKLALLRAAYSRVAAALGATDVTDAQRLERAVAAARGHTAEDVAEHVAAMDPSYLLANTPEEIARHLDMIEALDAGGGRLTLTVRPIAHGSRIAIVASDRTGLLGGIATVLAVHGISILGARLFTRSDGIAVDVFDVEDDRTQSRVPDERWARVRPDLEDVAAGRAELDAALEERARAYGGADAPHDVSVRAPDAAGSRHTVLEVRCGDRIGRLAQIVAALYAEQLDISVAKLDTRAGQVVDTFYVTRHGKRIEGADEILRTITAVRGRLRSDG